METMVNYWIYLHSVKNKEPYIIKRDRVCQMKVVEIAGVNLQNISHVYNVERQYKGYAKHVVKKH